MRCPSCNSDNPETTRFCGSCGGPLTKRCGKCGAENPPKFKFCGECGHALAANTVLGAASLTQAASLAPEIRVTPEQPDASTTLEGERKIVTALFADLKGSTALMEELDPEEAHAIVAPLLRIMSEAVLRYEGYVARTTGDGIFALFGAPAAYEDHTQRALYAALQMQQELRADGQRRTAKGLRSKPASGSTPVKSCRIPSRPTGRWSTGWSAIPPISPRGSSRLRR